MEERLSLVTHVPDSGGPLVLRVPHAEHDQSAVQERRLRLTTWSCTTPDCPCFETEIRVFEDGAPETDLEQASIVQYDPITKRMVVASDPRELLTGAAIAGFKAELAGNLGTLLEARAKRGKLRDRPRPWRDRDWSHHVRGDLVRFYEAVPGEFDLLVEHAGRTYWAQDMYCVNPACDCNQVAIEFLACADSAPAPSALAGEGDAPTGILRADLTTGVITEASHENARTLFHELRTLYGVDALRVRYGEMREMARDVGPRFGESANVPRTVETVPGRNDRCPCGSAKKFKKCCGAPGRGGANRFA